MFNTNFITKLRDQDSDLLFRTLLQHGEVRFIGGCVRDAILDIEFTDIDLATTLIPEAVIEILTSNSIKVLPTGISHGTVTAVLNDKQYQITTLRRDVACDGRRAEIIYTDDWQEDAARRDFTINAMSATIDGELFDYFAGLEDLRTRKVRFIGDIRARIQEDYLRILRFYRFSAKYGDSIFDSDICKICMQYCAAINLLSRERIYDEFLKISAHSSCDSVFKRLYQDSILAQILPGVRINLEVLSCLCAISIKLSYRADLVTILAALQYESPKLDGSLLKMKRDSKLLEALVEFNYSAYLNIEDSIKKFHYITGEHFKSFFAMLFAINHKVVYPQLMVDLFGIYINKERNVFPLSGADLLKLGYKSGVEIGKKLRFLESRWIESDFSLSKQDLLQHINEM
jgi:poly(A) polymerase